MKLKMSTPKVHKSSSILLIGAGPCSAKLVNKASSFAETVVAADGGYNHATEAGLQVDLVVGDMDSQSDLPAEVKSFVLSDQDKTDFEKCLSVCDAEMFLGVGFLGGRLDHQFAAFSALLKDPRPILLLDDQQVVFIAPETIEVNVAAGGQVGFYPLLPVTVDISGVRWPLSSVKLSPDGLISTSNIADGCRISIGSDCRGLLVILPANAIRNVTDAFAALSFTKVQN